MEPGSQRTWLARRRLAVPLHHLRQDWIHRGVQHLALLLSVPGHNPGPLDVVEGHCFGGGVIGRPRPAVAVDKGEDVVGVLPGEGDLLGQPLVYALAAPLRQHVEHVGRVAGRPLQARLARLSSDGVDPGRVPEHPDVRLASGAGDVSGQGPHVARPDLVGQHLVHELTAGRRLHVRLDEGLRVALGDRLKVVLLQQERHEHVRIYAVGQDAVALVLDDGNEDWNLVPSPFGDELPWLPRHQISVDN
mmetsp:Transcript_22023/g.62576  ORF Transcript_22023/g.62576 Transcript_22023/m.62576 type:complete len:247 (+) Transcript_22023:197-937(+)